MIEKGTNREAVAFKASWGVLTDGISLVLPEKSHQKLLKSGSIEDFLDAYDVVRSMGTQSKLNELDMNDPDINKMVSILKL